MKKGSFERGQALILIVFGIIALVGMTALAVDGGNVYSDRRNAQNAADTAALAAALAKINNQDIHAAGLARALSNGYNNGGTQNTVTVNNPPVSGQYSCANSPTTCNDYIQVIITSHVTTYFAPVIGVRQLTNTVEAVARAEAGEPEVMFGGNAMVGLAPSGCDAVYIAGHAQLQTWGGGLFSNSSDACGMHFQGSANVQTHEGSGGISMVASGYQTTGHPTVDTHGEGFHTNMSQYPYPPPNLPNPVCNDDATISDSTMYPGNYTGTFPPSGVTALQPGFYCVYGNWTMHGGQINGTSVTIIMENGAIDWNGNAQIKLSAPTSTSGSPYPGLLIYAPLSNSNAMTINGNSNSDLTGTILLPAAPISINGNNSQLQKTDSQLIGYTVKLSGSSDTQIQTNPSNQFQPTSPPTIQLAK